MLDLENLPNDSGCYIFKEKNDKIIYIGKAKNLKKRISSYYQKTNLDPKTTNLIERTNSIDYIVTVNEIEALILETTTMEELSQTTPEYKHPHVFL